MAVPAPRPGSFGLLLELERLQVAFYGAALAGTTLDGEAREFAAVAGSHAREHVRRLSRMAGAEPAPPDVDLATVVRKRRRALAAAVVLEDVVVAAYAGAMIDLGDEDLRAVTPMVSVEARHAAWVRDLVGRDPAPVAVDTTRDVAAARKALAKVGLA